MFTINIGCVVVNELSRLQLFTSIKDQDTVFLKVFQYFLRIQLEFENS